MMKRERKCKVLFVLTPKLVMKCLMFVLCVDFTKPFLTQKPQW